MPGLLPPFTHLFDFAVFNWSLAQVSDQLWHVPCDKQGALLALPKSVAFPVDGIDEDLHASVFDSGAREALLELKPAQPITLQLSENLLEGFLCRGFDLIFAFLSAIAVLSFTESRS